MRYGARNQIHGVVDRIKKGGVMAQVELSIPSQCKMASVLTLDSVDDLDLKPGDKVKVVVKAIHVLLVKEDYP